jgi:arabinose-5-phosphate isomerase
VVVEIPALGEAGPLSLAPTTSSVLQLAVADALAMCLLDARGFTAEQFASFHPEGTLGRRLLVRCEDLSHQGDALPVVREDQSVAELLLEMSGKGLGMSCVVDVEGVFRGVFTDGDLRRLLTKAHSPVELTISEAWSISRREVGSSVDQGTIEANALAVDALVAMRAQEISCLVIVDEKRCPRAVIRMADLLREGIADPAAEA